MAQGLKLEVGKALSRRFCGHYGTSPPAQIAAALTADDRRRTPTQKRGEVLNQNYCITG